jgi:WD40 repeat protein
MYHISDRSCLACSGFLFVLLVTVTGLLQASCQPAQEQQTASSPASSGEDAQPADPCLQEKEQNRTNLRSLGVALEYYRKTFDRFPPSVVCDPAGNPLYSWRVVLLPFLAGEDKRFKQFKLNEPWDSPHNRQLLTPMPKVYASARGNPEEPNSTFFRLFVGKGAALDGKYGPIAGKFPEGVIGGFKPLGVQADWRGNLANLIQVVEAGEAVPWSKPDELVYDQEKPLPKLGGCFPDGFHAQFANGDVLFMKTGADEKIVKALIVGDVPEADRYDLLLDQARKGRTASGKECAVLRGHKGRISSLAFSPDGKVLASASFDKTIALWEVNTAKRRTALSTQRLEVRCVAITPDGAAVVSSGQQTSVELWDLATAKSRGPLLVNAGSPVYSVAVSRDGKTLAIAGGKEEGPPWGLHPIVLWDLEGRKVGPALPSKEVGARSVAFSPDGKVLAAACGDSSVKLWDMQELKLLFTFPDIEPDTAVAFSPDGKLLAGGSQSRFVNHGVVKLWDVSTGKEQATLAQDTGNINSVVFSPDGKFLAAGSSDKVVRFWDVATGKEAAPIKGFPTPVTAIALSPDGKTLAAGTQDGAITLWDIAKLTPSR